MKDQEARYRRYADIFESPECAESIERGWRVLHWEFTENSGSLQARLTVTQHAREAQPS